MIRFVPYRRYLASLAVVLMWGTPAAQADSAVAVVEFASPDALPGPGHRPPPQPTAVSTDDLTQQLQQSEPIFSLGRTLKRTLVGAVLATTLGLALFVTLGQRKTVAVTSTGKGRLEVIASRNIAPRVGVSLLEVDGQRVLVARDAGGVKQMLLVPHEFGSLLDQDDHPGPVSVMGRDHDAVR